MRLALILVGVLFASLAHAQDLTGTYVTQGKNGLVVVRMAVSGARLTGTLSVTGHPAVELLGYVAGRYTTGTIVGLGEFEAEVDGDTLHYVLAQEKGPNRPAMTATLQLRRVDPSALARLQGGTMGAPSAPASGGGDPRLVGSWASQSMISSGSASMASEQFLRFNADGAYAQGKGRSVAGGVNWSYQGAAVEKRRRAAGASKASSSTPWVRAASGSMSGGMASARTDRRCGSPTTTATRSCGAAAGRRGA